MKKKMTTLAALLVGTPLLIAGTADAAVILTTDGFEGSTGNWTASNASGLFTYGGSGTNFATTGTGAFNIDTGNLTLTNALALDTGNNPDVTLSFDVDWDGGGSTSRHNIEVSLNGGTSWLKLGNIQNSNPYRNNNTSGNYSVSVTLTEGSGQTQTSTLRTAGGGGQYTGQAFTDSVVFRFNDETNRDAYIDNIVISSTVPEPGSLALLAAGGLCVLRRRRD